MDYGKCVGERGPTALRAAACVRRGSPTPPSRRPKVSRRVIDSGFRETFGRAMCGVGDPRTTARDAVADRVRPLSPASLPAIGPNPGRRAAGKVVGERVRVRGNAVKDFPNPEGV